MCRQAESFPPSQPPFKELGKAKAAPEPGQELGAGWDPEEGMGQGDVPGTTRALSWEEARARWGGRVVSASAPSGWAGCLHPADWRDLGWGMGMGAEIG